jgi:hypothetical protein
MAERAAELDAARREVAAHKTAELIASLRPCVQAWFATAEVPGDCRLVSDALPLGASRLGGYPDMPPDMDWPSFDGEGLTFLAQVNLAEVRADIERAGAGDWLGARELPLAGVPERQQAEWHASLLASLPRTGWLLLFHAYMYESDALDACWYQTEQKTPPAQSVCGLRYVRDVPASALRRRGGPAAGVKRPVRFSAHPLNFVPALSAPCEHPDSALATVLFEASLASWPEGSKAPSREGWDMGMHGMSALDLRPYGAVQIPLARFGLQLLGHSVLVHEYSIEHEDVRPLMHLGSVHHVDTYQEVPPGATAADAVGLRPPLSTARLFEWPARPDLGLAALREAKVDDFGICLGDCGAVHIHVPPDDLRLQADGHWRVDRHRADFNCY